MNFLDGIIGFISPKAGYARSAWRQAEEELRAYDAGGHDRLNTGWRARLQSGVEEDRGSRDTLRARARDLERNSDIMGGVLTSFERNEFGSGFRLQAKTGDDNLNECIEAMWQEWCKPRNCDLTGVQSFSELCRMALRRKKVDGGILILKRYIRGRRVPFCLQCIDMDELDTFPTKPNTVGNRVIDGVEIDPYLHQLLRLLRRLHELRWLRWVLRFFQRWLWRWCGLPELRPIDIQLDDVGRR